VGGEKRQNVSAGLTVDAYSGNSTQTMSGITIGATCAGKATATITCPNITVKDPSAMCEYLTSYCGGLAIEKVETLATVGSSSGNGGTINVSMGGNDNGGIGRCFYVTSITILGNTSDALVNGEKIDKCGITAWGQPACNGSALPETVDSGYYVFFPAQKGSTGYWEAQNIYMTNTGASLHANCK